MELLKIEFKKLVGNKSFWIFTLLFLIFLPIIVLLIPSVFGGKMDNGIEMYPLMPKTSETAWYYTCLVSSYFSMFILSFIIMFHISNEYSYRTVRQNVIDGLTRWEFVKGKLLLILVLGVLSTLYVFFVGLLSSWYFSSQPSVNTSLMDSVSPFFGGGSETLEYGNILEGAEHVIRFLLQIIGYFSFAGFIAFLLKKGALAVLLYFLAFIVEKIFGWQFEANSMGDLYDYFPLRSLSEVLPNPNFEALLMGISSPSQFSILNIVMVIFWTVLFLFFMRLVFLKRDIN